MSAQDLYTFMGKADANNDGLVSKHELQNFISAYDKDGDGKLSESEWSLALGKGGQSHVAAHVLYALQHAFIDRHLQPSEPWRKVVYKAGMAGLRSKVIGGSMVSAMAYEAIGTVVWEHGVPWLLQKVAPAVLPSPGACTAATATAGVSGAAATPPTTPTCVVCEAAPPRISYRPCGHRLVCVRCYARQIAAEVLLCPACGASVKP
mmetsp:Transcript_3577/g.5505  ORF Transcript_3577/g.5505 Transcript_3577/m.5505 type:complete len:206 (+) Transcript_3577:3-620(+)